MAELFGRQNGGLGLSFTRLTVGASDFSPTHYSYDDSPGNVPDPELRHFSIDPRGKYVLPRVRDALAINPDLKVMISPWSAPAWMKTTGSLIQGQLKPEFYPAFANYLARTVEGFRARRRAGVDAHHPERARFRARFLSRYAGQFARPCDHHRPLRWTHVRQARAEDPDPRLRSQLGQSGDAVDRAVRSGRAKVRLRRRLALLRRRRARAVASPRRISRQGQLVHRVLGRRVVAKVRRDARLDDRQADHRRR